MSCREYLLNGGGELGSGNEKEKENGRGRKRKGEGGRVKARKGLRDDVRASEKSEWEES